MGKRKKEPICNENCFECQYSDCIVDMTPSERKKWYNQDWQLKNKEKMQVYHKVYNKKYYQEHKEEIAIRTKHHRQKPEIKRKKQEYDRSYRLEHQEHIKNYIKEYRKRKKEE